MNQLASPETKWKEQTGCTRSSHQLVNDYVPRGPNQKGGERAKGHGIEQYVRGGETGLRGGPRHS